MEKQLTERRALPAHILKQVEQCGMAGQLAQLHKERREDKNGTREVRTEIVRSWMVEDQAQLPAAYAAQRWLWSFVTSKTGTVRSVGKSLGLVDAETGEELAGGRVDAIIDLADGEVLVVQWVVGHHPFMLEPEEDPGLVAMGLAACNGKHFRVANVFLDGDDDAICRRSSVYEPAQHPEQLERIRKLSNTPRDKSCPGSWCTHCRVAHHCDTWLAKAKAASAAMTTDLVLNDDGKVEVAPGFELTPENVNGFAERLELLGKVYDFAKDLRDAYVRRGGTVMLDGKVLVMSPRAGRVTVTASEFKPVLDHLDALAGEADPIDTEELRHVVADFKKAIKTGNPYEVPTWKKPEGVGGRR